MLMFLDVTHQHTTSPRQEKLILFGHLFFNITNAFCAKKRVGHACIPQDGHCLASFEVTPPLPEKVSFSAAKQNENSPLKTGCARPLLKKKFRPIFSFCFGCFCWRFCHADVDSREQQAILLKKRKNSAQNRVFPVFPAKKLALFCHAVLDFREHQGLPPD